MRSIHLLAAMMVSAALCAAQQPNSTFAHSLTIDLNDGPNYPMQINVRTNTVSTVRISGFNGSLFYLAKSGNGNLQMHSGTFYNNQICDIPLVPAYVPIADGFVNPAFRIPQGGTYSIVVSIPPVGSPPTGIPLNFHDAFQAILADFTNPSGFSLTAATRVTVTQGPSITPVYLGDEGTQAVALPSGMSLPFYGTGYTQLVLSSNGFINMGTNAQQDYIPNPTAMLGGPPRLASFFSDLDTDGLSVERYTIDQNPGVGANPYFLMEYNNVTDYAVPGPRHTFSIRMDTMGNIEFAHAFTSAASIYDTIVGIAPGSSINNAPRKDILNLINNGGYVGSTMENFYDWYGVIGTGMPNYNPSPPVSRPYNLAGHTVKWAPIGPGAGASVTSAYYMYQ